MLGVAYAWALLNGGELEAAEVRLSEAERWLGGSAEPLVADAAQFGALPASIATARAYLAQAHGDIASSVTHGRRALDLLPAGDHLRRGPAAALLGLAQWASGDLEPAYRTLAEAMAGFRQAGSLHFALSVTSGLADIRKTQGRLRDAVAIYTQALQLALAQGQPPLRGTADLYLGLSELEHQQGNVKRPAGTCCAASSWASRPRSELARSPVPRPGALQAGRGRLRGRWGCWTWLSAAASDLRARSAAARCA